MWKNIFFILISLLNILNAYSAENCITPNNEQGTCIALGDCADLFNLLTQTHLTMAQQAYLKNSQCAYDESKTSGMQRIRICCPKKNPVSSRSGENGNANNTQTTRDNTNMENNTQASFVAGNILPKNNECGIDFSDRIYGGVETKIDEFPWMALINYKKSATDFGFHCGGSLINSRYVLTAGHCVKNPSMPSSWTLYSVRLGEWDLDTQPDCVTDIRGRQDCAPLHRDVLIEKTIVHDSYAPESASQFFDIALLRLVETVTPYNDFLRPICLPVANDIRDNSFTGIDMSIAGWGLTETGKTSAKKLKIYAAVWNSDECITQYRPYNLQINATLQLCVGGVQGVDTCRGDSGGPLMVKHMVAEKLERFFAVGVVSYGPKPCGLPGWPGVYTRVGYFIDWIQSKLEV